MKKINQMFHLQHLVYLLCLLLSTSNLSAQQNIQINAALLDGVEINKNNILDFQILSSLNYSLNAKIIGKLTFREGGYAIQFSANQRLNPGLNQMDKSNPAIQWQYSSPALKDLFINYNQLPAGMYQFCIEVIPTNTSGEQELGNRIEECMYQKNPELFMIQLLDPENNAKLYEYNPMLSWVANYSLSTDLTYKLKVAEIQKGQSTVTAIQRNNPIFQESGLRQNTIVYPGYAKPLVAYQPYAWTVDAYYKGMLLGSAEPWRFVILEDSLDVTLPKSSSYIDMALETEKTLFYAVGSLKLKYELEGLKEDQLQLTLFKDDKTISFHQKELKAQKGENKFIIDMTDKTALKHKKAYKLQILSQTGKKYDITFIYLNPEFL